MPGRLGTDRRTTANGNQRGVTDRNERETGCMVIKGYAWLTRERRQRVLPLLRALKSAGPAIVLIVARALGALPSSALP